MYNIYQICKQSIVPAKTYFRHFLRSIEIIYITTCFPKIEAFIVLVRLIVGASPSYAFPHHVTIVTEIEELYLKVKETFKKLEGLFRNPAT